jgi:hypothetical protein
VTTRAVASRQAPRTPPRASEGAASARAEWRRRLIFPASPALTTYSLAPTTANQTGVFTCVPSRRNVARLM